MSKTMPGDSGQSELGFASVLRDCLLSGVIFVDEENKVATPDKDAWHILGEAPGNFANLPVEQLPAPLLEIVREAAASREPTGTREIALEVPSKGETKLRASAVPLKSANTAWGIALVLTDITMARRFEAHIQQLDRLANTGTLAATMAHEIKNAMVAGKTFVDLLLEQNQKSELVEVVRREMGRIDAIVARMLKLAGPARGAFSPVHVHELLEHSLRLVQPQLETKLIAINQSMRATLDRVQGDEYELQQAFINLLLNAFEAMGTEGTLSISTENLDEGPDSAVKQAIRVLISDTGIGIRPENMRHLFEPFFTTKPSGTGLGLAVTQRIVQEHHGSITAESQTGKGTTFCLLLPVE
jgi:two-component system sensor histidine kinase HydH